MITAQSVHERIYDVGCDFKRSIEESRLSSRMQAESLKSDLGARQVLHQQAERIWNTEWVTQEVSS